MKINREELYRLYMAEVDHVCDVCDWKTSFGPAEIVTMIAGILEENEQLITEK